MRTRGVLWFLGLASLLLAARATAQSNEYALSPWACGIIVWPHAVPSYAEEFAQRLSRAAETAFAFWGYALPSVSEPASDDTMALRIYDPANRTEQAIPSLVWEDRHIPPVVVLAFPRESDLRLSMGDTALYGAFWFAWSMTPDTFPHAEDWVWEIGTGTRYLACASSAEDAVLIHECTHWFTYEWCLSHGVSFSRLPSFVTEGMAELSCAASIDTNAAVFDRLSARAWAQHHCLGDGLQGVMKYAVGKSFVEHLVEQLSVDVFLDTLNDWAIHTRALVDRYEPTWRESLDLPAVCGTGDSSSSPAGPQQGL